MRTNPFGSHFKSLTTALCLTICGSLCLSLEAIAVAVKEKGTKNVSFARANAMSGHQRYPEAISLYEQALKEEPGNYFIHQMYGRTLALMGQLQAAIDQYRQALSLVRTPDAELENDIGVALATNDDLVEAAAHLKKSVTISSGFVAGYNNLGVTLERLGDFQSAKDAFEASLKLQPNNHHIQRRVEAMATKLNDSKHFVIPQAVIPTATSATPARQATTTKESFPFSAPNSPFKTGRPIVVRKERINAGQVILQAGQPTLDPSLNEEGKTTAPAENSTNANQPASDAVQPETAATPTPVPIDTSLKPAQATAPQPAQKTITITRIETMEEDDSSDSDSDTTGDTDSTVTTPTDRR